MSTKKRDLTDMMSKRTPLSQREAVQPVDLYTPPQVDNLTSTPMGLCESGHVDMPTSGQTRKPTKPQVEKYTTHLRPETIKAIKRLAFETERKDYEVVQQAIDEYLGKG